MYLPHWKGSTNKNTLGHVLHQWMLYLRWLPGVPLLQVGRSNVKVVDTAHDVKSY